MKIRHLLSGLAVVAALTGCEKNAQQGGSADADHMSRGSGGATNLKSTLPDNTGINTRDRNDITLTPGDQGGASLTA
ncbi:MAG TPA: hypothetical protein VFZ59_14075 [Verrucomicrobiae bacterium]|nr:hypothetical protein [Verrucomicrobiae bacterium]